MLQRCGDGVAERDRALFSTNMHAEVRSLVCCPSYSAHRLMCTTPLTPTKNLLIYYKTYMLLFSISGFLTSSLLVLGFLALVLIGEYLRKKNILKGENARKFVHAFAGTWAALWPMFLDLRSIAVLCGLAAVAAILFRRLSIFRSVYSVRRLSVGEILIGIGLALSALLANDGAVFSSAVLVIAWSDSAAAIVGLRYGKKKAFKILGSSKSLIGSSAFFASTVVVLMSYMYYTLGSGMLSDPAQLIGAIGMSMFISACLTVVELFGVYGVDNLTIPLFATIVLNVLG